MSVTCETNAATRALLDRIDALSEDNVRMILAYLAGYCPEIVEEQIARAAGGWKACHDDAN